MGVPSYQLTTNFSANCQLTTNFSANCQLTTIFWANCQLTVNPISTLFKGNLIAQNCVNKSVLFLFCAWTFFKRTILE